VLILGYSVIAAVGGLLAYFGVKVGTQ
jgi:hypothetical protein